MTSISPAEEAVEAAGFAVDSRELPRLLRLVARRLPADPGLAGRAAGYRIDRADSYETRFSDHAPLVVDYDA